MKIGPYNLKSVITSTFALDGGAMFGVVPKTMWSRVTEVDELNRIKMVTRTLLLESADKKILVDTGNGDKWNEKMKKIFKIDSEKYVLPLSLKEHGISPEEITDVICTHLHFDHVGGNTRIEGDELVPTFPNARFWIQAENWKRANHPSEKDRASYLSENWAVLAENGMMHLVKNQRDLFDSIQVEIVHGHTAGQQLPIISDGTNTLMYAGDLIPMKAHIPIPWVMAYDNEPLRTLEEKKRILPDLLDRDGILFFEHDPDAIACRLEGSDRGIAGGENLVF